MTGRKGVSGGRSNLEGLGLGFLEIGWIANPITAARQPFAGHHLDHPRHSLARAIARPLPMRGWNVGHLAVAEFPGHLVHTLEGELSRNPGLQRNCF